MRFWDSSAIVPLCLAEPETKVLKALLHKDEAMAVWWSSPVECASAFIRLAHRGDLREAEKRQALEVLEALSEAWSELEPSADLRDSALRLLELHSLRAADSLQLAAALVWADSRPRGMHFVCLDDRLRQAARREGFAVMP